MKRVMNLFVGKTHVVFCPAWLCSPLTGQGMVKRTRGAADAIPDRQALWRPPGPRRSARNRMFWLGIAARWSKRSRPPSSGQHLNQRLAALGAFRRLRQPRQRVAAVGAEGCVFRSRNRVHIASRVEAVMPGASERQRGCVAFPAVGRRYRHKTPAVPELPNIFGPVQFTGLDWTRNIAIATLSRSVNPLTHLMGLVTDLCARRA